MKKPLQKRSLETRARLVSAANHLISKDGFGALRVEEVVVRAGVAKGTFFAHFKDKDALMELLIGERLNAQLDQIEAQPAPIDIKSLVEKLMPLLEFMTCERYVFDVILRHSGAAEIAHIGPIALTFDRQIDIIIKWLSSGAFRKDVPPQMLAEGVQAFSVQAMGLKFCALHGGQELNSRLLSYLNVWLADSVSPGR